MKKYFLSVILLISALTIYGQAPHKSLKECNNDTIKYMSYNFGENKARYIGQPAGKLLDEVDFKIKYFSELAQIYHPDKYGPCKIDGLFLYYLEIKDQYRYEDAKSLYIYLKILFEEPWTKTTDEYDAIQAKYGWDKRWRPEYYELFKDYIIKDIELIRIKGDKVIKP